MSTKIGALQGSRFGSGFAPTVAFAALVAITTVAIVTSVGPDRVVERPQQAPATSVVTGTAANTPTEVRGGMAEAPATSVVTGSEANTPSEIRQEAAQGRPVGSLGGTAANTPSEMTGGIDWPTVWPRTADAVAVASAAERYDRHQRI